MNQPLAVITGATAGATEALLVTPFELVKIRLQDRSQASKYMSTTHCVSTIFRQEGPRAFFNGLESTVWRHIVWNAGYFGVVFKIRALLRETTLKDKKTMSDFLAGTAGGAIATTLNTPLDVVKSRIQNSPRIEGQTSRYGWTWPAFGTIAREEGFRALYKGYIPKMLRFVPGGGILLVVYNASIDFLTDLNKFS